MMYFLSGFDLEQGIRWRGRVVSFNIR